MVAGSCWYGRSPHVIQERTREAAAAGRHIHLAVGRLLEQGLIDPTPEKVDAVVRALTRTMSGRTDVNQRAFNQRIRSGVNAYFWRYCLAHPWRFVGAEYAIEGGRIDVVWSGPRGWIFDEIKTGVLGGPNDSRTTTQREKYARWGCHRLGTAFVGVRTLPLLDRQAATLTTAPGTQVPLPADLTGGGSW